MGARIVCRLPLPPLPERQRRRQLAGELFINKQSIGEKHWLAAAAAVAAAAAARRPGHAPAADTPGHGSVRLGTAR